jgi:hypothetical protein
MGKQKAELVDSKGGYKQILEERGINTYGPDMRIILSNHDDFKNEKNIVETKVIRCT